MARSLSAPTLPPLRITYYRRMKPGKIYPVVVRWGTLEGARTGGLKHVTIRLLLAGAQVMPGEQNLETRPDADATFFVTPLGRGWLAEQRLEVAIQGRKVQEVPFSSKVVTQRWAKFFFILAFVLPWLLMAMRSGGENWLRNVVSDNVPPMPGFVKDNVEVVYNGWETTKTAMGDFYASLWDKLFVQFEAKAIGFTAFVGCLFLALVAAFLHRSKRKRRTGEPILVPQGDE